MKSDFFRHRFSVFVGALLIVTGVALSIWALANLPTGNSVTGLLNLASFLARPLDEAAASSPALRSSSAPASHPTRDTAFTSPLDASSHETGAAPQLDRRDEILDDIQGEEHIDDRNNLLVLGLTDDLPADLLAAVEELATHHDTMQLTAAGAPTATVTLRWDSQGGVPFYRQVFAAATRFDVMDATTTWAEVKDAWRGASERYAAVVFLEETRPALEHLLGEPGPQAFTVADQEEAIAATWVATPTVAILPFEQLHPRLAVLAIDGQNPVQNAVHFEPQDYPLTAILHIQGHTPDGRISRQQAEMLQAIPNTNRNPDQLTVIAATGVTAMTRLTAVEMEARGYGWPAEVVGPTLSAADITVISNEVPFIADCEPNPSMDNLVFCSKPEYMETLLASGVTIVGLTGNHQNDFGWQGMYDTLAFYEEHGIPVYGGGADRDEATAPLYIEHNGNRLAFIGVNSFGPPSAWATETAPGSAPYDLTMLSATIRSIKEQDLADLVLAEFQYQESYDVEPLWDQRNDFRAVVRAGADIVTGVQSHVPQAVEFLNPQWPEEPGYSDDRLILYGLGNLYFDQMWSEATRDNLIAMHTVYAGRHLSTQLLTTVLHDYGQPRWAEADRHRAILERVFGASGFPP